MNLSAIVLTRNEEHNIESCLACLSWANEILVIDSGSRDDTVVLAEKAGAKILSHAFTDFASQRNFAMAQAKGDWILFVDADERVTADLSAEIKALAKENDQSAPSIASCVYAIPRYTYFFGKRLRFGDARGDAPVRFFSRHHVTWEQPVHEMIVTDLSIVKLKKPLLHYSTRDFSHYRNKVSEYIPLELQIMRKNGVKPAFWRVLLLPSAKFIQIYFCKLGILDGFEGFRYAILSAYYYTFQKYWMYWRNSLKKASVYSHD